MSAGREVQLSPFLDSLGVHHTPRADQCSCPLLLAGRCPLLPAAAG